MLFSTLIKAQEEFYGSNTGLTLYHSRGEYKGYTLQNTGLGVHFKSGLMFGLSSEENSNLTINKLSFGKMSQVGGSLQNPLKLYVGLLGGSANSNVYLVGMNFGMTKVFFVDKNFPFSISGGLILNIFFLEQRDIINNYESDWHSDASVGYLFGFTQAFGAQNRLTPVVGLSYQTIPEEDDVLMFNFGLNIKLN